SELSGYEKNEMINNLYLLSFDYLLNQNSSRNCVYVEAISDDTGDYHQIICYAIENDTLKFVFREDNSRLEFFASTIDNIPIHTSMQNYKKFEGVYFPTKTITTSPEVPIRAEINIESVKFDLDLESGLFSLPELKFSDYNFPKDSVSITVPVKYSRGHILVRLKINGSKFGWFILDTGASASFYDRKFVEGMKLESFGKLPAMSLGGFQSLELTKFDSISVGPVTLYNQTAGVMPLDALSGQIQKKMTFGGLLGYDFFVRFPLLINFRRQTLTIFNPEKFEIENSRRAIPFHLTMMVPTVKATVNGVKGDFLIDLGNAFGLIIHQNFGRRLASAGQLKIDSSSSTYLGGVGKGAAGSKISISNLMLEDFEIRVSEGLLADSGSGMAGSRYISGNIGTMILENYQILFDYANSRLFLFEPGSSPFKPH
ncbi:MAG: aspartyl protease family protein, partial [candidate division Zixibacteria bacterium]|nr:aspartyl protease family protein [candidate division Zixibacteria bacterium]